MTGALFTLAMPFAIIGGIMAFLITYEEMQHHFDRRRAVLESVKVAVPAFVSLVLLSLVVAVIAPSLAR